ncbi:MAG: divergent PAP2 family protein [Candidatus Goldbacteria bacterium]|nr:divergent PAP2 family protein [Candidatus Goldiibacteriota bacterium]
MASFIDGLQALWDVLIVIITHKIFYTTFISWFAAQFIKFALHLILCRKINFHLLVGTGGMPSSHTATVIAVTNAVGMHSGYDSAVFMVALCYCIVVISDAMGVRRAAGKQAEVLNKMMDEFGHQKFSPNRLKELLGHTPLEAIAGILIGLFLSIIIYNW